MTPRSPGTAFSPFLSAYISAPVATLEDLARVDTAALVGGVLCVVKETGAIYVLDRESTAAESLPDILAPLAGVGRWVLATAAGGSSAAPTPRASTGAEILTTADTYLICTNAGKRQLPSAPRDGHSILFVSKDGLTEIDTGDPSVVIGGGTRSLLLNAVLETARLDYYSGEWYRVA